jgi:predicted AAA+ superfamily ATPase
MKTIRSACKLQPNALDINVGEQIERLDEIIKDTDGKEYFNKTLITDGMKTLLSRGIARLAGKSNDSVFHLKQAMGGDI